MADWLSGRTRTGRTVKIPEDPYVVEDPRVFIDGVDVEIGTVTRLRDGGTTTVVTSRGRIHWPAPMRRERMGLRPTLDGDEIFEGA